VALSIKNDEADRRARELAGITGESLTEAVVQALRERLQRKRARETATPLAERLLRIGRACAGHDLLDERAPDEVLGYDENGLPT
jgi:antitoxin VapB